MSASYNREIRSINRKKLQLSGLEPIYIDGPERYITEEQVERIPFSQSHNTYKDWERDVKLAFKYARLNQEIPADIFFRLKLTALELGLVDVILTKTKFMKKVQTGGQSLNKNTDLVIEAERN